MGYSQERRDQDLLYVLSAELPSEPAQEVLEGLGDIALFGVFAFYNVAERVKRSAAARGIDASEQDLHLVQLP